MSRTSERAGQVEGLNLTPETWAQVRPDAFLDGSIVQARNVLEMALQDIAKLAAENAQLRRAG